MCLKCKKCQHLPTGPGILNFELLKKVRIQADKLYYEIEFLKYTRLIVCLRLPAVRYSTRLPGILALCPVLLASTPTAHLIQAPVIGVWAPSYMYMYLHTQ